MSLTAKQQRFCEEYVVDFNGKQAAIRAGYSKKTAKEQAARLLTNVNVQEKIKALIEAQKERLEVDADYLTNFFKEIIETGEKDSDRVRAAENLAKRIGYYGEHNKQKQSVVAPKIILSE